MSIPDELLIAELLGALDPGDAHSLAELIQSDGGARFRRSGLGLLVGATDHSPVDETSLAVEASLNLAEGDGLHRVGQRLSLTIDPPVPPETVRLVCLRALRGGPGAEPIFPRPEGPWPTLDAFCRGGGSPTLDLVIAGPAGGHIYSLILLPEDLFPLPWPEGDPRWGELTEAFDAGRLSGRRFEVEVQPDT